MKISKKDYDAMHESTIMMDFLFDAYKKQDAFDFHKTAGVVFDSWEPYEADYVLGVNEDVE